MHKAHHWALYHMWFQNKSELYIYIYIKLNLLSANSSLCCMQFPSNYNEKRSSLYIASWHAHQILSNLSNWFTSSKPLKCIKFTQPIPVYIYSSIEPTISTLNILCYLVANDFVILIWCCLNCSNNVINIFQLYVTCVCYDKHEKVHMAEIFA